MAWRARVRQGFAAPMESALQSWRPAHATMCPSVRRDTAAQGPQEARDSAAAQRSTAPSKSAQTATRSTDSCAQSKPPCAAPTAHVCHWPRTALRTMANYVQAMATASTVNAVPVRPCLAAADSFLAKFRSSSLLCSDECRTRHLQQECHRQQRARSVKHSQMALSFTCAP